MFAKKLITIAALTVATLGFADNRGDYNYPERNYGSSDQPMSSRQKMDQMQERVITPDAGPKVASGVDAIITADFIYWRTRQDGMAFAETGVLLDPANATENSGRGSVQHPNFDWNPGFKVGLGMALGHDGWDVYAQYTWLRSNPSRNTVTREATNTQNSILNTFFNIPGNSDNRTANPYVLASGNWKLYFNTIDGELGRNFYVSKYLTTRPFVGFKGTWQDDDLTLRYRQTNNTTQEVREKNNVDYWAFGIRGGMNTAWYMTRNFCLFADWALSAMWGKWDVDIKDKRTPDISDPDTYFITRNTQNEFYSINGVLEWIVGLRYDVWWSDDDYHFGIQAGWEEQLWFDHNQHYKTYEEANHGGLNFQGLDLKVRFDF